MRIDGTKVLVAEHHYISRHLLIRDLNNWGFITIEAEDGEKALSILEGDDAPPLAILDWSMPGFDGPEICQRISEHANRPFIYIILLAANAHTAQIAGGLHSGADDVLSKPFAPDELRSRLDAGLRLVSLERNMARTGALLKPSLLETSGRQDILPVCMYCGAVHEDRSDWQKMDLYLHRKIGVDFAYSVCPDCLGRLKQASASEN